MKHNVKDKLKPYEQALLEIRNHYLLGALAERLRVIHIEKMNPNNIILNKNSFGYLTIHDEIESRFYLNKEIKLDKKEWYFIFATILIILGLDLYKKNKELLRENAIFIFAINYVENILNISDIPTAWKNFYEVQKEISIKNEDSIYEQLLAQPKLIGLINQLRASLNLYREPLPGVGYICLLHEIISYICSKDKHRRMPPGNYHSIHKLIAIILFFKTLSII